MSTAATQVETSPSASIGAPSYRALQWILFALLLLHGLEELVAITVFRPQLEAIIAQHPGVLSPLPTVPQLLVFLSIFLLVAGTPIVLPLHGRAAWVRDHLVAAVAAGFFVNALAQHLTATLRTGTYTPGVLSAVLLAMPFSVYFVVRSLREGRVGWKGLLVALAIAGLFLAFGLGLIAKVAGLS
jgi:hypothetical protein